nr:fibroleukin [Paramormyrops kingsleyae]
MWCCILRTHRASWLLLAVALLPATVGVMGGGGCQVRLLSEASCKDGGECPYQLALPPLTLQLPKELHLLETTAKELQILRTTVDQLRNSCQACGPRADRSMQGDRAEVPGPDSEHGRQGPSVREMQAKMSRMSNSLRNARSQIGSLQGRLEELTLLNMENVEAMMNSKVQNLTGALKQLSYSCSSQCSAQASPQFLVAPRDCSDYNVPGKRNGLYRVTPDPRNGTFEVLCDMESYGGGWTVLQQRLDGSVSFNRTWDAYKHGFGNLRGEFWLGNDRIHLLTKAKDMVLRVELEDFEGVREYAKYERFYVADELLRYRLSVGGYSGTAGNALRFNKLYDHDQKSFTTPDKDNDMYPSGNCGAFYSSGWWFDACMAANLNGKYYNKPYKGVRNGIFWGTWHNMSNEYYPTNYRQSFKTVKMMIRPKNYTP